MTISNKGQVQKGAGSAGDTGVGKRAEAPTRKLPDIATDVLQDSIDLRDLVYRPALKRLLPRHSAVFLDSRGNNLGIQIRDQGNTDRCTGFSLASLIDIQQFMERPRVQARVQARAQRRVQGRVQARAQAKDQAEEQDDELANELADEYADEQERDDANESANEQADGLTAGHSNVAEPVSAHMLFEMGALHSAEIISTRSDNDQPSNRPEKNHSIRSAIKGFYHNGVCPAHMWPKSWPTNFNSSRMIECMKSARKLSLGAYYRLQHHLSDYHSALNEVGCLLVSAHLHRGWTFEEVAKNGRIKMYDDFAEQYGAHAFVIVGYDEKGFLVLNSWGPEWAGRHESGAVTPGIAHWSYKDWAESIMDAWVLRLAVSTPDAFEYTQGAQGSTWFAGANANASVNAAAGSGGMSLGTSLASVPRQHVIGHYVHFESAGYVESGSYPDSEVSLKTTLQHINRKLSLSLAGAAGKENNQKARDTENSHADNGETDTGTTTNGEADKGKTDNKVESSISRVYLRVSGDTGSVEDAMHRIAMLRRCLRPQGIYPLTFVWTARIASAFAVGIKACMVDAVARMPDPSTDRDELIESLIRPIGHPLWNQLKQEADAIILPHDQVNNVIYNQSRHRDRMPETGPLYLALMDLNRTIDTCQADSETSVGKPIDLCFEGAGALVFISLLRMCKARVVDLLKHVRQVTLAYPVADHNELLDSLRQLHIDASRSIEMQAACSSLMKRIYVLLPNEDFLTLSSIGPYTRSWFHLANNSFESRPMQVHAHRSISLISESQKREYQKYYGIPKENLIKAGPKITRRGNSANILRTSVVSKPFLDSILGLVEPVRDDGAHVSTNANAVADADADSNANTTQTGGKRKAGDTRLGSRKNKVSEPEI